mmetsp:Transcript_35435/g.56805  ORF Transcript_35435/g.56805 Transcript_35435/m.56805 type:complete len:261 (-) Transcript_35435:148-930(-)
MFLQMILTIKRLRRQKIVSMIILHINIIHPRRRLPPSFLIQIGHRLTPLLQSLLLFLRSQFRPPHNLHLFRFRFLFLIERCRRRPISALDLFQQLLHLRTAIDLLLTQLLGVNTQILDDLVRSHKQTLAISASKVRLILHSAIVLALAIELDHHSNPHLTRFGEQRNANKPALSNAIIIQSISVINFHSESTKSFIHFRLGSLSLLTVQHQRRQICLFRVGVEYTAVFIQLQRQLVFHQSMRFLQSRFRLHFHRRTSCRR